MFYSCNWTCFSCSLDLTNSNFITVKINTSEMSSKFQYFFSVILKFCAARTKELSARSVKGKPRDQVTLSSSS